MKNQVKTMSKHLKLVALGALTALLPACTSETVHNENPSGKAEIRPLCLIGEGTDISRAGGVIKGPESTIKISVVRVDVPYPGSYAGLSPIDAEIVHTGTPKKINFTNTTQYYLPDDQKTKLAAVYPIVGAGEGTWDNSGTVTYDIMGNTDILGTPFSDECAKSTSQPTLTFDHLLTRVDIYVYANSASAQTGWGKITEAKVLGRNTKCIVQLPAINTGGSKPVATASGSITDMNVFTWTGGAPEATVVPVATESVSATFFGCCMFVPKAAAEKLKLKISTEKTVNPVEVTLATDRTYLPGYYYKIILKFADTGVIEPTLAKIEEWKNNPGDDEVITVE